MEMKITARCKGVTTEHEINPPTTPPPGRLEGGVMAVVMFPGIKVDAPTAYKITPETTVQCMKDMSQKAWEHISTGPLFQHLFNMLFKGHELDIPAKIEDLLEEDMGTIHGCGLIIQLVEARFDGRKEVFIQTPEAHLHPGVVYYLMSTIYEIQKIPMGGDDQGMQVEVV